MFTPIGYFAAAGGGAVITDNLQQWLDVVGAGGTESSALTDSSGNGRNATNSGLSWDATNSWWYVSGNTDWTKHIDSNYRIPSLTGNTNFTFESWINLTSTNNNNYIGFIHNRSGIYGNNFVEIAIGGNPQGDINFAMIDSSGNEAAANSPDRYQNQWIMVTLVNDGSTNTMTMFVNGVSVHTGDSSTIGSVSRAENYSLYGNFLRSGRNFDTAKFGSYRLYDVAHTATEALNNFEAEKSHFGL